MNRLSQYLVICIARLKHVHIFLDDLFLGLLAGDELGMTADVIRTQQIGDRDYAVASLIHLVESLVDYIQPCLRQWPLYVIAEK